ncbi:unnamed protein product [Prorocentrum cordatum]|uniref:Uncharacterized protein n=1 Tax=Prorocentrum cordatum TaxID=2364126 RepID=A0ABN9WIZ5_9DINO|nr:unnamed protein product [Polarella glacialis]
MAFASSPVRAGRRGRLDAAACASIPRSVPASSHLFYFGLPCSLVVVRQKGRRPAPRDGQRYERRLLQNEEEQEVVVVILSQMFRVSHVPSCSTWDAETRAA